MNIKQYSGGFEKFEKIFLDSIKRNIGIDKIANQFNSSIVAGLEHDRTGPNLSKREEFLWTFFREFSEITKAFECLNDIQNYCKYLTVKEKKNVSNERLLRLFIESYYQEVYILKERLIKFTKFIGRKYFKSSVDKEERAKLKLISVSIEETFKNITLIRGRHVHEFKWDDDEFNQIFLTKFLSEIVEQKDSQTFNSFYKVFLKVQRKKWINYMRENNKTIKEYLDFFFTLLTVVLSTKTKTLKLPKNL